MVSSSQPNFIRSVSDGDSKSAAFNIATCREHLRIFSMDATLLGVRQQGEHITNDAQLSKFMSAWADYKR